MYHANFIQNIRKFIDLEDNSIPVLEGFIRSSIIKKNEFLLKEGQVCRLLYFVEKAVYACSL